MHEHNRNPVPHVHHDSEGLANRCTTGAIEYRVCMRIDNGILYEAVSGEIYGVSTLFQHISKRFRVIMEKICVVSRLFHVVSDYFRVVAKSF
jgi:hypothetical protein